SRGLFDWMKDIPDFVVGGVSFDNWITNKVNVMASRGEAIEVDATETILALHQNHGGDPKKSHEHPKSYYNRNLASKYGGTELGHVTSAACNSFFLGGEGSMIGVNNKFRLLFNATE
ncbi:Hypothetical protein, putative, partial [Bodo saltans]